MVVPCTLCTTAPHTLIMSTMCTTPLHSHYEAHSSVLTLLVSLTCCVKRNTQNTDIHKRTIFTCHCRRPGVSEPGEGGGEARSCHRHSKGRGARWPWHTNPLLGPNTTVSGQGEHGSEHSSCQQVLRSTKWATWVPRYGGYWHNLTILT